MLFFQLHERQRYMNLGASKGMKMPAKLKVGIQGVKAAFHDVAARKYFQNADLELLECASFHRLCDALANKETDFNLMAIENSIAGSILPNYLLLEKFGFQIVGEVFLRIEMNLMALPGQRIEDLQIVQSHPMALYQCEDFLARHPHLKAIESADTAESAKEIFEKKLKGQGAIASRLAAQVYHLELLETGIETNKKNYTRFLVVSRGDQYGTPPSADKASLRFEVRHEPGSLLAILSVLAQYQINMTKLQSVPLLGKPKEYAFHLDIEWTQSQQYQSALKEIKTNAHNLIHFGEYKKAELPGEQEA
jgi:prephenate dehydratase